jgi:sodium transport system permease protein
MSSERPTPSPDDAGHTSPSFFDPESTPSLLTPSSPLSSRPLSLRSRLGRLGRLIWKELSEILRDRRTIITLVLMPLLLYPLLSIAFKQFFLASAVSGAPVPGYRLAFRTEAEFQIVKELIGWAQATAGPKKGPAKALSGKPRPEPELGGMVVPDLDSALHEGTADLAIQVRWSERLRFQQWILTYLPTAAHGKAAADYVEALLSRANGGFVETQVKTPEGPVRVRVASIALPVEEITDGLSLAALIPLILILMTITGAVYPAIDLTAGERERGTLEILVAAPVPRMSLLFAKYVSVVAVAVLTGLVNLVTMLVTLRLSELDQLFQGLTTLVVVQMFGLLLLFAAFFSAVLLSLASFARSFKEAQAYLIPLMLVSLAPGLIGMLPGIKLEGLLTVAPLVNVVLLGRDLFDGKADPAMALVVILSTALYALAAIAVAARVFGSESVLYSEQSSWSDLFRRPKETRAEPTLSGALFCFALMFPAFFVFQSLLTTVASLPAAPAGSTLILQVLATAVLFVGFPLLAAARGRVRMESGFQLRAAPLLVYPAAILLALSLLPFVYELFLLLQEWDFALLKRSAQHLLEELLPGSRTFDPAFLAVMFGLIGVLEEVFFRGFLFSALRAAGGVRLAIPVSAALFSLFHAATLLDKLIPSLLLGLILGWLCWRTGSIFPGMLLHATYNGILATLPSLFPGQDQSHLAQIYLATAGLGVALAVSLIQVSTRSTKGPAAAATTTQNDPGAAGL